MSGISSIGSSAQGDSTNRAPRFGQTRPITRLSTGSDGRQANSRSVDPVLSADGKTLAFASDASNLVDGDTNGVRDIFVQNLQTDAVTRISVAADGSEADDESDGHYRAVSLSADGTQTQRVAFSSDGTQLIFVSGDGTLVPDDANGVLDVLSAWTGQTTTGLVHDKADQVSSGTSGRRGFADPDVGDTHTVTVKAGDGAVGTLTARVAKEPGTAVGVIDWDYSVDHRAVATLVKDQTSGRELHRDGR